MEITSVNSYMDAVEYVLDIPKFASKSTMETTRAFYNFLGCPSENRIITHVAGTNGKGSTCTYIASIIKSAGHTVGVFTSPHLVSIRERFKIDDELISEEEFLDCFYVVATSILEFRSLRNTEFVTDEVPEDYHPSFFEFLFLMAMVWFDYKQTEYIVLETGLGGRLDATNILYRTKVSVITDISMDHMEYLGDTLEAISKEKAGIIKEECPVVYFNRKDVTSRIIRNKAKKLHSRAIGLNEDDISDIVINKKFIDFCLHNSYDIACIPDKVSVTLPTCATYQSRNASLSLIASAVVLEDEFNIETALEALAKTTWSGRMEEVRPGIYVDGAHNIGGVEALIDTLKVKAVMVASLIFGVSGDKQYDLMINRLVESGLFKNVYLTCYKGSRSAEPDFIKNSIQADNIECVSCDNINDALDRAQKDNPDVEIYVVGSLYLVGEVLELMKTE